MSQDKRMLGIGGAPTRATTLPEGAEERKKYPVASGVLDYFPDALVAISKISQRGNDQHNPGKPLNWNRSKSADESDTMIRHFLQRGTLDTDGTRHTAKLAWRALALLQKEIEAEQADLTNALDVMRATTRPEYLSADDAMAKSTIPRASMGRRAAAEAAKENPCGCAPAFEPPKAETSILPGTLGTCDYRALGTWNTENDGSVPHKKAFSCPNWKPLEEK